MTTCNATTNNNVYNLTTICMICNNHMQHSHATVPAYSRAM